MIVGKGFAETLDLLGGVFLWWLRGINLWKKIGRRFLILVSQESLFEIQNKTTFRMIIPG